MIDGTKLAGVVRRFGIGGPEADKLKARMAVFAAKRGIAVGQPGWENAVLFAAALEHPEIDPEKRGRGRPPKERKRPRGLLGGALPIRETLPTDEEVEKDAAYLQEIEEVKAFVRSKYETELSDADAVRLWVRDFVGHRPGKAGFDGTVNTFRNKLSRARKRAAASREISAILE